MELESLENITGSIDELAKRGSISRNRAFAAWYAITFFNCDEDEALEAAASDGGNDQGIDLAFADDSSQELIILQAHCPENLTKVTPKNKWDAVTACLPFISNTDELKKAGRSDLAEYLNDLKIKNPDYSITVGLITLGKKNDSIDRAMGALNASKKYSEYNFFHFSQKDIQANYKSLIEAEGGIPEDSLNFVGSYLEDNGEYGRSWVGTVTAKELGRLHKKHQNKLFAGNIRLFLGSRKGGINDQIIKTAKEKPGQFWALNNGITIVADQAAGKEGESDTLTLRRFSIVNGCQTTSCLVSAGSPATVKVLARVIAAKTGLKTEIVRFNNSQNAVKIWAVRAADHIQESLRREFKQIGIDYAPKQEGTIRKRDENRIDLDKVTQYIASSDANHLIQAINNKSELFDEPYQKIFKKGIKASEVYLAWLTGNISSEKRQEKVSSLPEDEMIGLLSVTSDYWIIYGTYKIMRKFSDLSSPHLTIAKMHSDQFRNSLKKHIEQAIDLFYDAAIDTYEKEEYGSFKSTLRSAKFLGKIDSKMNSRITRLDKKSVPDLAAVCKTIK